MKPSRTAIPSITPSVWTKVRTDRRRNARSTHARPSLNVLEEYDEELEDYCYRARANPPEKTFLPVEQEGISKDEWAQIIDSMTPEEWAIFISNMESEEAAIPSFEFPSAEWPSLATKLAHPMEPAKKEAVIEMEPGVMEPHEMEGGFVAIKADDTESQSWAVLSKREEDVGSVMSWSTAPLSFRDALLTSNGPMRDVQYKAANRDVIAKPAPFKEQQAVCKENDVLYELRESAKTMRGGKPQFRVKAADHRFNR